MAEIVKQTLTGEVELDGNTFRDCEFVECTLLFEGGTPPNFVSCNFKNSRFRFGGTAANTVNFLRAMAAPQSNMRMFVLGMMPELSQN